MTPQYTLAKKLAEVMAAVARVPKNGHNAFHNYDYATEGDIVAAVRGELAARGIILLPAITGSTREPIGEKGDVLTSIEMQFTFHDGDSGESFMLQWSGAGVDKSDKGLYKATTGGEKYFLLKTFLIPTGDDPEIDDPPADKAPPRRALPAVTRPAPPRPALPQAEARAESARAVLDEPAQEFETPDARDVLRVTLAKVAKIGKSQRGPWALHIIKFSDGREGKTFDADLYAKGQAAAQDGYCVDAEIGLDGTLISLNPLASADDGIPF